MASLSARLPADELLEQRAQGFVQALRVPLVMLPDSGAGAEQLLPRLTEENLTLGLGKAAPAYLESGVCFRKLPRLRFVP
jgi:hypothetical protein